MSLTDFTDVEGMQPPHFASAHTAASPLNDDSSVTLSANPSVTEYEPEVYGRNRDYQLGYRAPSLNSQEGTDGPEHRMVSPNDKQGTGS